MTSPESKRWFRRERWRYAGGAFLFGGAYSLVALLVGLEAKIGGVDVSLLVSFLLELTFAVFGFLIGFIVEVRREERLAASQAQERLRELADLKERLAQTEKLASLGQLASTVAHEVRNPLAILRSMTQNLSEELAEGQGVGEGVAADSKAEPGSIQICQDMIEEIDRLANVTSRLVDFARPVSLRLSEIRFAELANRVRLLSLHGLGRDDIQIELSGDEELSLEVDSDLLSQLLLGLLENAVEASPRHGKVMLRWSRDSEASSEGQRQDGSWAEIRVEDEGEGVPEELHDRIFEPFFTTRPEGHGLGLAVARHLVEAHGGQLSVEKAGPEGAEPGASFLIRLPIPV